MFNCRWQQFKNLLRDSHELRGQATMRCVLLYSVVQCCTVLYSAGGERPASVERLEKPDKREYLVPLNTSCHELIM